MAVAPKPTLPDQSRSTSTETVTVFCRLPHGLRLSVYDLDEIKRRDALSRNKTPDYSPVQASHIVLRGARDDARYHKKDNVLLGMAGRTDVPKDFWDAWYSQNKNSDFIRNHLVFAETTERAGAARQAELAAERTGFESLDPDAKIGSPLVTREKDFM